MTYCNDPNHKEAKWRVGLVRYKGCYQCKIKWRVIEK